MAAEQYIDFSDLESQPSEPVEATEERPFPKLLEATSPKPRQNRSLDWAYESFE